MLTENDLNDYQNQAVNKILQNTHYGLILDMGLGKTVSTLTAINKLIYEELEIKKVLVIAPKRVIENVWTDECEKWEHLRHLKISKIVGNELARKKAMLVTADIYLISRDNIAWLCGQFGGSMIPFDMLVVDESSSFKNPKSVRFKALRLVQSSFDRVVILTGTPAPNGLMDLWPQIYLLDRGERLGKTITQYRNTYFNPNQRNGHIIYNYKIKEHGGNKIHNRIEDICLSMKAEDYVKLPDRIDNNINLTLPNDVKNKYLQFEKEQVLELMKSDITAANAAALSNKLLQFSNGAVYDEAKNVHEIHDIKIKATEDIIQEAQGNPVLIAWTYRHDLERLLKALKKYKPRELKTSKDISDWNKGNIQVMLMHPASGGHGLNLQGGGNIIIWFGQTWSLELYQQFNARLRRRGQQKSKVIIHHLIAKSTLDEDVIKSLEDKNHKQEGLINAIKAKLDKYLIR